MHKTYYLKDILIVLAIIIVLFIGSFFFLKDTEALGKTDYNCHEFRNWKDAQRFFEDNDPKEDPYNLDGNNDGVACQMLK